MDITTQRLSMSRSVLALVGLVGALAVVGMIWTRAAGDLEILVWAFVIAVLGAGLVTVRRIDRRLSALTALARSIEKGQVEVPADDPGRGALGDLSTAIQQMAHRVHERVHYDVLTALPNRRFFDAVLDSALDEAGRRGLLVGVVLLDLDLFKDVNDGFGHECGDAVLREVAVRLQESVRDSDTVARLGGDEFGVVIARAESADGVMLSARRLLDSFRRPYEIDDREMTVTASIGVGMYPKDGSSAVELVRSADAALYRAKNEGGDHMHVFDDLMNDWARLRSELGEDLRLAIRRGDIRLHYQPQVRLHDGLIVGIEALARWDHPERGALAPTTFIAIAEETGQIPALGARILEEACLQNAKWHRQGVVRVPIAVNVSMRQLQAGNMVPVVEHALRESALPAKYLRLEMSDNGSVRHMEKILECVAGLGRAGVRFAMDDFGTGYSSMRHLLRYPLCTLKIDRSLVAAVPGDADSATIVGATIGLADGLGLEVIAEGLETRDQLAFLREAGCYGAQGYLVCRPMDPEGLTFLLKRGRIDLDDDDREVEVLSLS